tara:strand:+ start:356 stop:877 length:522 start_codon:yes stop_codon:yes gene_type:complete
MQKDKNIELKIDLSDCNLQELRSHKIDATNKLKACQEKIKHIEGLLQVRAIMEVARNLQVMKRENQTASSTSMTISQDGTNLCKIYHGNTPLAHQITLIPEMLKIVQKVAQGELTYRFKDDAEQLLKDISSSSVMWEHVGKEKHKVKAYRYTDVSKLVQKKDKSIAVESQPPF